MFKHETKIEKAFTNTVLGIESKLIDETSFGEEEIDMELFTTEIPRPPACTPPLEIMKPVLSKQDKDNYKRKLYERTKNIIKEKEEEERKQKLEEERLEKERKEEERKQKLEKERIEKERVEREKKEAYESIKEFIINVIKGQYDEIDECISDGMYQTHGNVIDITYRGIYAGEEKFNAVLQIIKEFNESCICPFDISYDIVDPNYMNNYKDAICVYFDWSQ